MVELQGLTCGIRRNEEHYCKFDTEIPDWATITWVIRSIPRE
jgi:hypothetical protein